MLLSHHAWHRFTERAGKREVRESVLRLKKGRFRAGLDNMAQPLHRPCGTVWAYLRIPVVLRQDVDSSYRNLSASLTLRS